MIPKRDNAVTSLYPSSDAEESEVGLTKIATNRLMVG